MKFPLSLLKKFLNTSASLDEISTTLTAIGLEVEGVENPAESLKDFIVAEIEDAQPHPNASKLQVCRVNDGAQTRQIVCGAPNARAGLKTVLAREGVYIPGSGITIKKTKIRDVESNGMLCSAGELGLDGEADGILELAAAALPGSPAAPALGLDDAVIDINITPNRADCFGVYGVARDLAAAGLGTLAPLPDSALNVGGECPVKVTIETPNCPLFTGCLIRGVKNGPSPDWLQRTLRAAGLRPISALVDITNYFSLAFARPLHVYDAAKLKGGITVRAAREGERLSALNDQEYPLSAPMTVIADERGALGLGGIIGGKESGCTEDTTDVFVESAYFTPENIAATGRTLGILSDARTRFERGVDAQFTETGLKLAATMILELCGGSASGIVRAGAEPAAPPSFTVRKCAVKRLGGVEVSEAEINSILTRLGFAVKAEGEAYRVTPPGWRRDTEGEADAVEEILRIRGYGQIPATPLPKPPHVAAPALNALQRRTRLARRALAARGFMEACSFAFLPRAQAERFGGGQEELTLLNPISTDLDCMRPSLLPNLLAAMRDNAFRGQRESYLFEIGAQFADTTLQGQKLFAGAVRGGELRESHYPDGRFTASQREPDAFDAKGDCFALLRELGFNPASLAVSAPAPSWYHPGRSGTLSLGKTTVAHFGELHPDVLALFGIKGRACAFELALDAIPMPKAKTRAKGAFAPSDFQAAERDFAFVVREEVSAFDLLKSVQAAEKQLVKDVQLFDVFRGKGLAEGHKSMALRVTLQAADRTLTDAEIAGVQARIVESAAKSCGAQLRQ